MNTLYKERFKPVSEVVQDVFNMHVYVNGEFKTGDEAAVSVWEHGLLYGDGVFEGIRAYDGKIFRLEEHLERLVNSAHSIGIREIPLSSREIREVIVALLQMNSLRDAHIKPMITRGIAKMGLDPRKVPCPSILVYAYPYPPLLGEKAVRLITSSVRRKSLYSVDARIKTICYVDNILAKLQSNVAGMDDALMLDPLGFVAEATGENVFVFLEGKLCTPFTYASLPGITRAAIIQIARDRDIEVLERNMTPGDLYVADEVFLTGTAAEIVPVGEIDGRAIRGGAPGPVTKQLIRAYQELIERESESFI